MHHSSCNKPEKDEENKQNLESQAWQYMPEIPKLKRVVTSLKQASLTTLSAQGQSELYK